MQIVPHTTSTTTTNLILIFLILVNFVFALDQFNFKPNNDDNQEEKKEEKINYSGHQLWKIQKTNNTIDILSKLQKKHYPMIFLDLAIWGTDSTTIHAMIHAGALNHARRTLDANKLQYEISIFDIQKAIDLENAQKFNERFTNIKDDDENNSTLKFSWNYYHTLDEIYNFLHNVVETSPQHCQLHTIGTTSENRPIYLLKIQNQSNQQKKRAIFIDGGIHAREWISPAATTYLINYILTSEQSDAQFLRENFAWYIIPILNPDGYEYSHKIDRLWRKNRSGLASSSKCVGVDLNRNFGYLWNRAADSHSSDADEENSKDPCENTYGGPFPFSESETQAVATFLQHQINANQIKFDAFISLHSYGQFIVYPWSGSNDILQDYKELELVGKRAVKSIEEENQVLYATGPTSTTIYPASGSSMDWARGALGIKYVYTIELRDRGQFGFLLPSQYIKSTAKDALIAIKTIARQAVVTRNN